MKKLGLFLAVTLVLSFIAVIPVQAQIKTKSKTVGKVVKRKTVIGVRKTNRGLHKGWYIGKRTGQKSWRKGKRVTKRSYKGTRKGVKKVIR
jgi:hypothetical protein